MNPRSSVRFFRYNEKKGCITVDCYDSGGNDIAAPFIYIDNKDDAANICAALNGVMSIVDGSVGCRR